MTGADFKVIALGLVIAVFAPALVLAFLRVELKSEEQFAALDTWWGGPIKYTACVLGTLVVVMFIGWNDKTDFFWMLGRALALTAAIAAHVFVIVVLAKIGQMFIKPQQRHIPIEVYASLFFVVGLFQNYVQQKGFEWFATRTDGVSASAAAATPRQAIAPTAPPMAAPSVNRAQSTETLQRKAAYDAKLGELERRYPAINPDSPQFDAAVTEMVSRRMDTYAATGIAPADALIMAVTDVFEEVRSRRAQRREQSSGWLKGSTSRAPPENNCVFKAVMSDADYRACGLEPPR